MVRCVHCVVWRITLPQMMRGCGYLQPCPPASQYCKPILKCIKHLTMLLNTHSDIVNECLLQNVSLSCSDITNSLLPKCLRAIREDVRNIKLFFIAKLSCAFVLCQYYSVILSLYWDTSAIR